MEELWQFITNGFLFFTIGFITCIWFFGSLEERKEKKQDEIESLVNSTKPSMDTYSYDPNRPAS